MPHNNVDVVLYIKLLLHNNRYDNRSR